MRLNMAKNTTACKDNREDKLIAGEFEKTAVCVHLEPRGQ